MGKLCKDQLAEKLAILFGEADPQNIDDAVAQAKSQLGQSAKRSELENLFDTQIATLKERGVPEQIVEMCQNQRSSVLAKASETAFKEGRIPFLPVIPRDFLSIYSQMVLVKIGGKTGVNYLKPSLVTNVVKTPDEPYYIFDIEDGEAMLDKAPKDAKKFIKKQGRRGLIEVEVISLCVHTNVLSRHFVDATGSRCRRGRVPCLGLCGATPRLHAGDADYAYPFFGAASCGE